MGDLIELTNEADVRFEAFSLSSELLTASVSPDGKKMIHGVASSTTKDLHGDTILLSALEDMERSAVGLTVYLNHKYEVPDDVGGTITKAIIRQKGVDEKGDPNYQLEVDIEIEDENPAALQTHKYIAKGRKLGLSIGAMIPKDGAKRQKDGTYVIEHLQLLELSMVGIPANPKSWIDYAASALRGMVEKATTTNLGNPTLTLEGGRYRIEGSVEGLELNLGDAPTFVPEVSHAFDLADGGIKVQISRSATTEDGGLDTVVLGAWDLKDEDDRVAAIASAGEEAVQKATVWVETRDGDTITIGEPETSKDAGSDDTTTKGKKPCSECGKTNCDHDGDLHDAAPDPDVTDAKVRIIEVDTDDSSSSDSSQGASSSEPDDADETFAASEADVTADGDPLILDGLPEEELLKLSFGQLRAAALRATTELVAAKTELAQEKAARIAAENQRDEVAEAAAELVRRTAEVIKKVGDAPLPRKAVLKGVEEQFSSSVEAYYGTTFARALAQGK